MGNHINFWSHAKLVTRCCNIVKRKAFLSKEETLGILQDVLAADSTRVVDRQLDSNSKERLPIWSSSHSQQTPTGNPRGKSVVQNLRHVDEEPTTPEAPWRHSFIGFIISLLVRNPIDSIFCAISNQTVLNAQEAVGDNGHDWPRTWSFLSFLIDPILWGFWTFLAPERGPSTPND